MVILALTMLLMVAYFIITNYYQSLQKSKEEVLHRLMAISHTAAVFVDGDLHGWLSTKYMSKDAITQSNQDSAYLQLHLLLKKVRDENNLKTPLYSIVYYDRDSTFHFIVTSSENPYFRHSYKNYPKELLKLYETGGILDSYRDENGQWLSAVAPIKDRQGKVVGLLEADENFEIFSAQAKGQLLTNSLISLSIVIPFLLIMFNYVSRSLAKQAEDQISLINQKEEIESQNEEIKSQSDLIEKQNHELDRRVKERTAELEASNSELANFLYHSSHDVQAPIATLKGLQSLAANEASIDATREYVGLMQNTTLQLERMVKTITLVHELKVRVPAFTKINLRECVDESLKKAVGSIKDSPKFSIIIPDNLEIVTDRAILQPALFELFKNSIQYRDLSGTRKLNIKVTAHQQGDRLNLFVEDNGDGILPEAKSELFTMFKRGNEKSTGIGLGLYIAQTCLVRLGGEIALEDKEGDGAKFRLSFLSKIETG